MKTLLLIDANSFIHRAFHALPPLKNQKGEPTGALYGLTNTLLKLIQEKHPEYVAAAFDRPEPTFRKEKFEAYKAHRPEAPDELISQIIESRVLFKTLGIPIFEIPKYEADDLIGTLAETFKHEKNLQVLILTGDLDTLQLVDKNVLVEVPRKGLSDIVLYDDEKTKERFGVPPSRLVDYKGLAGDSSDNIPGVPGVGPKTAASLLQEFDTVENIYKNMNESHRLAKKLLPHKTQALLSKELATINTNSPLKTTLKELAYREPEKQSLFAYLENLGFESIIKRLGGDAAKQQNNKTTKRAPIKDEDGVIFIENESDLTKKTAESKKCKVALHWKGLLKTKKISTITQPIFDARIAAWLLAPGAGNLSLEAVTKKHLGATKTDTNKEVLRDLFVALERKLKKEKLEDLFRDMEMPIVPVLAGMELRGIGISKPKLEALLEKTEKELFSLRKKIYKEAGKKFNINSPKQLGEILFDKLGIQDSGKKTTRGQRTTKEEVLVELKNAHPVIPHIMEYRETFKIKSTYLEPLIEMEAHGRIHTTYLQTGTATGRISSEKPNLQNIPQESKWATPLRNAFEAGGGRSFLAADYSQLELRLLAHTTRDPALIEAFEKGSDIHRLTAAKVLGKAEAEITAEERRLGKTLNFGIVYGMGTRSFAKNTGLSQKEASEFISAYFTSFPNIKSWHKEIIEHAHAEGFVKNENGRKRWFEHAGTSHPRFQAEINRMAINMPIQSLGADILKLAMLETPNLPGELLLSIHDELLFEIRDDILEKATEEIKRSMESVYHLHVPLIVEIKTGKSWGNMRPIQNT